MSIYNFKCEKCNHNYEQIVKIGQEYDQCPLCRGVTKRTHCDLPSPHLFYDTTGSVYRPAFGKRKHE